MLALTGQAIVLGSVLLLYLASPNQPLIVGQIARGWLGWSGVVTLLLGFVILFRAFDPATAIFVAVTVAMLAWSVFATVVGWWRRPRKKRS